MFPRRPDKASQTRPQSPPLTSSAGEGPEVVEVDNGASPCVPRVPPLYAEATGFSLSEPRLYHEKPVCAWLGGPIARLLKTMRRRMRHKEATARIKINKLLEAAGWRFFPEGNAPANIRLEPSVTIKSTDLDALGDNFEKTGKGFIDFLLLDAKGFPFIVLEAKVGGQEPAGRQGAGPQICPLPELPLRHPLQRQPALLLGSGTRQPLHHHLVSDARLGDRLPEGHARTRSASSKSRSATTTSSSPSARTTNPKPPGRTKPSAPATSRPTSSASCAPIS